MVVRLVLCFLLSVCSPNGGSRNPSVLSIDNGSVKKVSVRIKEGSRKNTQILDLSTLFTFRGVKRQFSLQAASEELITVSESGILFLTSEVDYEQLCQNNRQPCKFQSKVKNGSKISFFYHCH